MEIKLYNDEKEKNELIIQLNSYIFNEYLKWFK